MQHGPFSQTRDARPRRAAPVLSLKPRPSQTMEQREKATHIIQRWRAGLRWPQHATGASESAGQGHHAGQATHGAGHCSPLSRAWRGADKAVRSGVHARGSVAHHSRQTHRPVPGP